MPDRKLLAAKRFQGSFLQLLPHSLDVILILFAQNAVLDEVHLHPLRMCQAPQGTAKHDTVKAAEDALALMLESGDSWRSSRNVVTNWKLGTTVHRGNAISLTE
jgi:hypothetical protein